MSKSTSYMFFCHCKAMAQHISSLMGLLHCPFSLLHLASPPLCEHSPPGVNLTLQFLLKFAHSFPFHSSVGCRFAFPFFIALHSASHPQLIFFSPSHPSFPSHSGYLTHHPSCASQYCPHHCYCYHQDSSFCRFPLRHMPSSHHHHFRLSSYLNSEA